jgi:ABC-2 type transport system permease protein
VNEELELKSDEKFTWSNTFVVFNREFANYFNTPIGYIFLGIFVSLMNFLFFFIARFWDTGRSIQGFFDLLKVCYIFFIPAITMRLWSEEKKSGTIEILFTLPLGYSAVIFGKFLSAMAFLAIALSITFPIALTVIFTASPDAVMIFGGYMGALFMGSCYISMGLFISWQFDDQIIAFLVTLFCCFFLYMLGYQPVLQFFGPLKSLAAYLSVSWHFDSLYKGLLDSRDIIYFILFSSLFLYLNRRAIDSQR